MNFSPQNCGYPVVVPKVEMF